MILVYILIEEPLTLEVDLVYLSLKEVPEINTRCFMLSIQRTKYIFPLAPGLLAIVGIYMLTPLIGLHL